MTTVLNVLVIGGVALLGLSAVLLAAWMLGMIRAVPVGEDYEPDMWEQLSEEDRAYLKRWAK